MRPTAFHLIAVIHLPPLPGSPRYGGDPSAVYGRAVEEAGHLQEWGFADVMIENYGDAPFQPGGVGAETVASMAACLERIRGACPGLRLGVNVLRCDAPSALAVALAGGGSFIRVNVHSGVRLTDQGLLQGQAHVTLRRRSEWRAQHVAIYADASVKHSRPLAPLELDEEIRDLEERALADAILVTGARTGSAPAEEELRRAKRVASVPVYLASGLSPETAHLAGACDGAVVSSSLRCGGRAGAPLERSRALALFEALEKHRSQPA
jgi:uncharacterized protein